ncbi:MAG: hypothetical protein WBO55_04115 [Rhizobiaceae bacterium]
MQDDWDDRKPENRRLELLRARNLAWSRRRKAASKGSWTRQSWTLPREEARRTAQAFLDRFPRAAYGSEVESWRVLPGDMIEFTMRRYPSAD